MYPIRDGKNGNNFLALPTVVTAVTPVTGGHGALEVSTQAEMGLSSLHVIMSPKEQRTLKRKHPLYQLLVYGRVKPLGPRQLREGRVYWGLIPASKSPSPFL